MEAEVVHQHDATSARRERRLCVYKRCSTVPEFVQSNGHGVDAQSDDMLLVWKGGEGVASVVTAGQVTIVQTIGAATAVAAVAAAAATATAAAVTIRVASPALSVDVCWKVQRRRRSRRRLRTAATVSGAHVPQLHSEEGVQVKVLVLSSKRGWCWCSRRSRRSSIRLIGFHPTDAPRALGGVQHQQNPRTRQ
jgi:hypothetical protein